MQELRIGVVGLGTMGAPMAANLLRAGFRTSVFKSDRGSLRAAGRTRRDRLPHPAGTGIVQ